MTVCCENCGNIFAVPSGDLSEKGSIVLCTRCQHPHQVFRKVVPFRVLGVEESHHVRQWSAQATVTSHTGEEEPAEQAIPTAPRVVSLPRRAGRSRAWRLLTGIALLIFLAGLGVIIHLLLNPPRPQAEPRAIEPLSPGL